MKRVIKTFLSFALTLTACVVGASIPPQNAIDFPEGERIVYTRLVEAYRHNQLKEVIRNRKILERNYPLSVHLDNAYYLTGKLQFQQNDLGDAVQSFAVVRDRFEKSNKRSSAMFALAMTYQRLNLMPQAHRNLEGVLKDYPGSSESHQAWMQLQLEKNKGVAPAGAVKR